jgi:hypothetical protein
MPWYLHLYHLSWLLFFIGMGYWISWWLSGAVFSVMAVTIFMRG